LCVPLVQSQSLAAAHSVLLAGLSGNVDLLVEAHGLEENAPPFFSGGCTMNAQKSLVTMVLFVVVAVALSVSSAEASAASYRVDYVLRDWKYVPQLITDAGQLNNYVNVLRQRYGFQTHVQQVSNGAYHRYAYYIWYGSVQNANGWIQYNAYEVANSDHVVQHYGQLSADGRTITWYGYVNGNFSELNIAWVRI